MQIGDVELRLHEIHVVNSKTHIVVVIKAELAFVTVDIDQLRYRYADTNCIHRLAPNECLEWIKC